jgi:hypothetical protein
MDKILVEIINVKYQENPSSEFRAAQCQETDGYGEAKGCFYRLLYEA